MSGRFELQEIADTDNQVRWREAFKEALAAGDEDEVKHLRRFKDRWGSYWWHPGLQHEIECELAGLTQELLDLVCRFKGHSFERGNIVYDTYPQSYPERCKVCGLRRTAHPREPFEYTYHE